MAPYLQLHSFHLWLMLGLGVLITIAIVLARGSLHYSFSWTRKDPERYHLEDDVEEFGDGVREGHGPLPIFFRLVVLGWVLWAVGYVIFRAVI